MQVLPQCGHAVHEDAPDKVRLVLVLEDGERTMVGVTLNLPESRISLGLACIAHSSCCGLHRCTSTVSPDLSVAAASHLGFCVWAEELLAPALSFHGLVVKTLSSTFPLAPKARWKKGSLG